MGANDHNITDESVREITEYYKRLLNGSTKVDESEYYINLGVVYCGIGDFEKAIIYFKYFLKINKKNSDKAGELKCYQGLSVAHRGLGDVEKANEFYVEAEKIFAEIKQTDGLMDDLNILYKKMANTYKKMNSLEEVCNYVTKLDEINRKKM
ncbi:MAG: hypothetical protein CVU81_02815 [Euryarchaeota archaeon HGW-Euryarchaeota-1]|nr:MAG: hypothetical protein CVU81_02815 [Euryarchaeota archaeon HGW-Euryarchaeota-1]